MCYKLENLKIVGYLHVFSKGNGYTYSDVQKAVSLFPVKTVISSYYGLLKKWKHICNSK